ncbi:MAG: secondary thiamine-phosphate synthase enzyme YjbQ [Oscillospiraceae bacterium]|jgi:secondary thiamine-phosphate synthase enzyme|nr:secondary thiamine-phosphate synthase enzyme YjbQ [Oscillospiraceae bacterium]
MLYEYNLNTGKEEFYDITRQVAEAVSQSGVTDGTCVVFCPHTTAGITVNENADPDVRFDMLLALEEISPNLEKFRHGEGNSAAHVKASLCGSSVNVIISGGKPLLGMWQAIYFCEFDGPRRRKFYVKATGG